MARQRLIAAPPRTDVYVGMLGLTCLAMLTGIVALLLEFSGDYDFEQQAKAGPAVSLPKDYSRPAPKSDGITPAPAPAPMTKADPLPPAPALPPEPPKPAVAATPPTLPLPLPAAEAVAAPNPVKPAAEPTVVRPGFNPRFPR